MLKLTLPEISQIFGKKALSIFEKYGTKAAITDFAILRGGFVSSETVNDSKKLEDRTGYYWTKTDDGDNDARVVTKFGYYYFYKVSGRNGGCRPALPFSSISSIASNGVRGNDGVLRVEYGEYPQQAVDKAEQEMLENLYNSNLLNQTGRVYTTDSRKYDEYDKDFSPQTFVEYEYNGRKFVRVIANSYFDGENFELSTGDEYKDGDAVWVEVTPITWLVDEEKDIAVSERILVAGVLFNKESNYKGNFSKTDMNSFMNTFLVNEIVQNNKYINNLQQIYKRIQEINLQKSILEEEKIKLEQELIKLSIQKTKRLK